MPSCEAPDGTLPSDQRSAISDQRSAISDQRSAISDQRSAISDQRSAISDQRSLSRELLGVGAALLVLLGGAAAFSGWKFGSPLDVRRVWSPGTLTIVDRHTDLGTLPASGVFLFHVKVRNDAARPLTIVGAKSACKCMAADKLPVTLAVGATHPLRMALRLDGAKAAEIPVVVYTEDGQAHEAAVEFAIEPQSQPVHQSPAPAGVGSPVAAGKTTRGVS